MNTGKKIIKGQNAKKNDKKKNGVVSPQNKKILAILLAAIVIILAVGVGYEQLHPKLIVTVDSKKLYLSDMMYDIYNSESVNNSMDSYYQAYYGKSYWDIEVDDAGTLGKDFVKTNVMDTVVRREVLFLEATKKNYVITQEEKDSVVTSVKSFFDGMTKKQKLKLSISEEKVKDVLERNAVAARYEKDTIDAFAIDDEAIKATVKYEDYRQYDLQYYFAPFTTTDETGKSVAITDTDKEALKAEMAAFYQETLTAPDFTTLIAEGEATTIKYTTNSIVETDTNFLSEEKRAMVKKMANGEMSEIIEEEEDGLYIVKMIENNSATSYDEAVKKAITTEEETQFNSAYADLEEEYAIDIKSKEWDKIEMGEVTL